MDERLLNIQATPVKESELHPGRYVVELEADDFNYLLHKATQSTLLQEALHKIGFGVAQEEYAKWAEDENLAKIIMKGYIPAWRPAAEYRGAMLASLRHFARTTLAKDK